MGLSLPWVVEGFCVVPVSRFPRRGRDAHVGLDLLLPVGLGLHHGGLVHVVLVQAVALEGALSSVPLGSRAVTSPLLHLIYNIYIYNIQCISSRQVLWKHASKISAQPTNNDAVDCRHRGQKILIIGEQLRKCKTKFVRIQSTSFVWTCKICRNDFSLDKWCRDRFRRRAARDSKASCRAFVICCVSDPTKKRGDWNKSRKKFLHWCGAASKVGCVCTARVYSE